MGERARLGTWFERTSVAWMRQRSLQGCIYGDRSNQVPDLARSPKKKMRGLAANSLRDHRDPLASGPLWRPLKITAGRPCHRHDAPKGATIRSRAVSLKPGDVHLVQLNFNKGTCHALCWGHARKISYDNPK